jgi:hypothetical protein
MESPSISKAKAPVTEETGCTECGFSEDYALPHREHIWTSSPKVLPGPDNHPFFLTNWNACDLSKPHQVVREGETTVPPISPAASELPPDIFHFGPPPVYPFIPPPTIDMLPSTPENVKTQKLEGTLGAGSPAISTPGLTNSATNIDDSPRSRPSSFDDGLYDLSLEQSPAGLHKAESCHTSLASKSPEPRSPSRNESQTTPTQDMQPVCHLTYIRAVSNEATAEPAVFLSGQIWRSSNQKKKGWRRNQWVLDVR